MPRAQREELLVQVAYEEFARHGYDGVSMERIARRADVTKPLVYAYFGSKDALYAACARRLIDPMLRSVRAATHPELPSDQQLWAGILAQLGFIDSHRDEWRAYVREAEARGGLPGQVLAQGRGEVTALLAELVRQAIETAGRPVPPQCELDAQACVLQGAVERIAQWWEQFPDEPLERVALRVMNFAWQGFGDMLEGRFWMPPASTAADA